MTVTQPTHYLAKHKNRPGGNFRGFLKLPAWAVFIGNGTRDNTISQNYLRKCLVSGIFGQGGKKKITQPLYQKLSEDVAEKEGFEPSRRF